MLSIKQIKFIRSLKLKKNRDQENCFIIEGPKLIEELLKSDYKVQMLCATDHHFAFAAEKVNIPFFLINESTLEGISNLKKANKVLAVVDKSKAKSFNPTSKLILALDDIKDPGNMGTIIRLAEWYGITDIICSKECVDIYNPKVVQSTMGSMLRMNIIYEDLPLYLSNIKTHQRIGASLEGENMNKMDISKAHCLLVIGSESHGISKEVLATLDSTVYIPKIGLSKFPESLNAASATAILLSKLSDEMI